MLAENLTAVGDNEPVIIASCQQTRFHLADMQRFTEVNIPGLNLAIAPSRDVLQMKKPKAKAAGQEIEILSNAELRLKAGVHYGLLGHNGTGKSTLLRAIAEKTIPGLPQGIRIAILQQTTTGGNSPPKQNESSQHEGGVLSQAPPDKTVLQHVIESDQSRGAILHDINFLTSGMNDSEDTRAQIRQYRQLRHDRLQSQLLEVQNKAFQRSGTRGLQARKDLLAFEKEVAKSREMIDQDPEDIESPEIQGELEAASELLVNLQTQLESINLIDIEKKAYDILRGLGFADSSLQKPFKTLSGGWRMRCILASVLIQRADIMILDEPTNFLDLLGIVWLQKYLIDRRSTENTTVVLVSHDRDFIDNVCEEVILLGDQSLAYFRGNLSAYEEDLRSRILYLTRMQEAQDREASRIEKTINANIKLGKKTGDDNKLRMAKSRQKKMEDRAGMQVSATGGRFKLSRDRAGWQDTKHAAIEIPKSEQGVSIMLPMAPDLRFPGPLISLEDVHFRYTPKGDFILRGLDLTIHMGDRVGVVGLNGCGKSTLIKIVTEIARPDRGTVTRHPRLRLGYYSQHTVEDLQRLGRSDLSRTALNTLAADVGDQMTEQEMRGLLGSFGLQGRTASDVPIAKLSGGQLVRLALVRILWNHPNLLVLDEVTTHLDYRTVIALANALSDFNGALLLVTHDRFLVRRVIEGEQPEDVEDDEKDPGGLEALEARRRSVYTLNGGKLKLQAGGMRDFEKSLEKKVAKMPG